LFNTFSLGEMRRIRQSLSLDFQATPTRVVFPVPRSFVSFLSLFRRLSGATQMFAIRRVFFKEFFYFAFPEIMSFF